MTPCEGKVQLEVIHAVVWVDGNTSRLPKWKKMSMRKRTLFLKVKRTSTWIQTVV